MKALVLSNNKWKEVDIKDELSELQSMVGGYISYPTLSHKWLENGILTIVNDEGKFIHGMRMEMMIIDSDKYMSGDEHYLLDIVFGNIIFVAEDGENIKSLSDEQIQMIKEDLKFDVSFNNRFMKCLFV